MSPTNAYGVDHIARLAEQLGELKGTFILSINDTPEIRRIFAAFAIDRVELTYTIGRGEGAPGGRADHLVRRGRRVVVSYMIF